MVCKELRLICNLPRDQKLTWVFYPPNELVLCTLNGPANIINDNHTISDVGHFLSFLNNFEVARHAPYKRKIIPMKHVNGSLSNGEALPSPDRRYMIFGTQEPGPGVTFTLDCGSTIELDCEALDKMINYKAEIRGFFEAGINPEICDCSIKSAFFALPCSSTNTPTTTTIIQS